MNRFFEEIKSIINTHDLIPKLISLLLAVILWAHIVNTQVGEVTFKLPVEYKNIPESLIVIEKEPPLVTITFKGKKDLLRNINTKNIKVFVNLQNPKVNKTTQYPVLLSRGELPDNIEISTNKKFVTLTIENKISKKLPVKVNISNKDPDTFILGQPTILPPYVTVSGPESIIASINVITTEPVGITSAKKNINTTVSADISDFKNIKVEPDSLQVKIPVFNVSNLHLVKVPLKLINTSGFENIKVSPSTIKVYTTKSSETTQPDAKDFRAYIDFNSIDTSLLNNQGKVSLSTRHVKINYSSDDKISIIEIKPESINIELLKVKSND